MSNTAHFSISSFGNSSTIFLVVSHHPLPFSFSLEKVATALDLVPSAVCFPLSFLSLSGSEITARTLRRKLFPTGYVIICAPGPLYMYRVLSLFSPSAKTASDMGTSARKQNFRLYAAFCFAGSTSPRIRERIPSHPMTTSALAVLPYVNRISMSPAPSKNTDECPQVLPHLPKKKRHQDYCLVNYMLTDEAASLTCTTPSSSFLHYLSKSHASSRKRLHHRATAQTNEPLPRRRRGSISTRQLGP